MKKETDPDISVPEKIETQTFPLGGYYFAVARGDNDTWDLYAHTITGTSPSIGLYVDLPIWGDRRLEGNLSKQEALKKLEEFEKEGLAGHGEWMRNRIMKKLKPNHYSHHIHNPPANSRQMRKDKKIRFSR